jgi:hypothetical protein
MHLFGQLRFQFTCVYFSGINLLPRPIFQRIASESPPFSAEPNPHSLPIKTSTAHWRHFNSNLKLNNTTEANDRNSKKRLDVQQEASIASVLRFFRQSIIQNMDKAMLRHTTLEAQG